MYTIAKSDKIGEAIKSLNKNSIDVAKILNVIASYVTHKKMYIGDEHEGFMAGIQFVLNAKDEQLWYIELNKTELVFFFTGDEDTICQMITERR